MTLGLNCLRTLPGAGFGGRSRGSPFVTVLRLWRSSYRKQLMRIRQPICSRSTRASVCWQPFVPLIVEKRGRDIEYSAKAVTLGGARYIVCINPQQAEKDAADRAAVLAALERQLKRGDKALVGNTGYRRF